MHLLSIVLLAAIYLGTLNATCLSQSSPLHRDGCFVYDGLSNSFCEAAKRCARLGKKLNRIVYLVGRNSPKVHGKHMKFWTGVNQLLIFRNKTKKGWFDVNPFSPKYVTGSDFPWEKAQPDGYEPVTYYGQAEKSFYDYRAVSHNREFSVVCEYGSRLLTNFSNIKFQAHFPVRLNKLIQTNSNFTGCFDAKLTQVTGIECAFACARDVACRSVYYNKVTAECFRVMYADSLLDEKLAKREDGWTRFARTAIPIFLESHNGV